MRRLEGSAKEKVKTGSAVKLWDQLNNTLHKGVLQGVRNMQNVAANFPKYICILKSLPSVIHCHTRQKLLTYR